MRRREIVLFVIGLVLASLLSGRPRVHAEEFPFRNPSLPIDQRIEDLLAG